VHEFPVQQRRRSIAAVKQLAADDLIDLRKTMQLQTISKAVLAAAAGSLFALGASPAFAMDTADLTVKGTIVPAACSANFTGGDTVDFGTIKVVDLLPSSYNPLGTKDTAMNVTCSSDKRVTFTITDLESASKIADATMVGLVGAANASHVFGLGTATVGGAAERLGGYSLHSTLAGSPTADGTPQSSIFWNGAGWANALGTYDGDGTWSFSGGSTAGPATGKSFVFPIRVTAALNRGSALQVASDTPLNGQAMFTIKYE